MVRTERRVNGPPINTTDELSPDEIDELVCAPGDTDRSNPISKDSFNTDKIREANLGQSFPTNVICVDTHNSNSSLVGREELVGSFGVFTFG
jgi:hypothetical protein